MAWVRPPCSSGPEPARQGRYLFRKSGAGRCFAPEDLSEEQRQLGKTAGKFGREEVAPVPSRIDEGEHALVAELLRRSGELGLLGTEVPEEYGGLAPDKATNVLIAEELGGRVASVTGPPPRRRAAPPG